MLRFLLYISVVAALCACTAATAQAADEHDHGVNWQQFSMAKSSVAKTSSTSKFELFLDSVAFSPNGDTRRDSLTGFVLVVATGQLTITARDVSTGVTVATLYDAPTFPGFVELVWDGNGLTGTVPDGRYEIRASLTGLSGAPTIADRSVDVDTSSPPVVVTSLRSRLRWNSGIAPLKVTLKEPSEVEVDVSIGSAHRKLIYVEDAGSHSVAGLIPWAARRITARGSIAKLKVKIRATDLSLNQSVWQSFDATMPAKPDNPVPPPTSDPTVPLPPSSGTPTIRWPLSGPITSQFGQRNGRLHAGIDIGVPAGRRISAAAAGVVTTAGWVSGYGNCVIVKHRGGWSTLYAHQSRIAVKRGKQVRTGGLIGYVGSTGNSTGPHLHFETRKANRPLNPLLQLR